MIPTPSEALQSLGFNPTQSLVLTILHDCKWHTYRDLERSTDKRQPEVYLAVRSLSKYLEIKIIPKVNGYPGPMKKGRPEKAARMSKDNWEKMTRDLMRDVMGRHDAAMKAMDVVMGR